MVNEEGFVFRKKRPSLKKIFGAEMGVIIILLVVIFSILGYLGVLPTFLSFLSQKEAKIDKTSSANTVSSPAIGVASEVNGYKLRVKDGNSQALVADLEKLNVWGKKYNASMQNANLPLKIMLILLTDKKDQGAFFKDEAGNTLFSYSIFFTGNQVLININLSDSVLKQASASQVFGNAFGHIISNISGKGIILKGNIPTSVEFENSFIIEKTD